VNRNDPDPVVNTIVIVGVGLIGGSLGRAIKARGICREVIGVDTVPSPPTGPHPAVAAGAVDRCLIPDQLAGSVAAADLIVLATPVGTFPDLADAIAPHLGPATVVTDTGSTKEIVVARLTARLGGRFVGGHPIAGKEHSGVAGADPDMFDGATLILTPTEQTDADARERVTALWRRVGAQVIPMAPALHDQVFACVSHLPHLAAFALMQTVAGARTGDLEPAAFAAGGLRDFTRVAASNPAMWRDICLTNRDALGKILDAYMADLGTLREAISQGDGNALERAFEAARQVRARMHP